MNNIIPGWARSGASVICIDASSTTLVWRGSGQPQSELKKGQIYEIRWAGMFCLPVDGHWYAGCSLVGIERIDPVALVDVPFGLRRFRPLVAQQDDIVTHFAQHLEIGAMEMAAEGLRAK